MVYARAATKADVIECCQRAVKGGFHVAQLMLDDMQATKNSQAPRA